MLVKVLESDTQIKSREPKNCMMAVALNRVIEPDCYSIVGHRIAHIHSKKGDRIGVVWFPEEVSDKIRDFITGKKVEPFEFELQSETMGQFLLEN
jgi:hypothetical protein